MTDTRPRQPRNAVRKWRFGLAVACVVLAVVSGGGTIWAFAHLGKASVITASLIATTVFLASMAFVLHVMSQPPRVLAAADDPPG